MRYLISLFNDCWCVLVYLIGVLDGSWLFFLFGDFLEVFLGVIFCDVLFNSLYKGLVSLVKFGI